MAQHLTSLKETVVERDTTYTHRDRLMGENMLQLADKAQLESRIETISSPKIGYKKSKEFVDSTLDMMKSEITDYLHVVCGDIKTVDHEFPYGELRSLQDF